MNVRFEPGVVAALLFATAACGNSPNSLKNGNAAAGTSGVPVAGSAAGVQAQTPAAGSPGLGTQAGQSGTATAAGTGAVASAGSHAAVGGGGGGGSGGVAGAPAGTGGPVAGGAAGTAAAGSAAPATGCDRACLLAVMQGYLDALVAKDSTKIKTASTLKYTENGKVVQLGDGLWKTASKLVPDARLDFADPTLSNVTSQVVVDENGTTPVLYQVRLKVVDGAITEIESMAVRQAGAANGFFNAANLKPEPAFLAPIDPAKRMTRDALNALMQTYLDYLEGKKRGADVAFDTNCKRYENGVATASGLASFQAQSWSFMVTRRILVIDEEAGIVWGMFPFTQSDPTLVVGEAFKMVEGKIMMIQAIMANMPSKVWN
jgi:hypothetical protein